MAEKRRENCALGDLGILPPSCRTPSPDPTVGVNINLRKVIHEASRGFSRISSAKEVDGRTTLRPNSEPCVALQFTCITQNHK